MNIQLSPAAAEHLKRDLDGRVLRIAFTTGCGGSGYRLGYAPEPVESDAVIAIDGIRVALDSMAASQLDGARIEYDADEDGYLLEHPDAVGAVWCG
ncbi:MAG TPA: iron-sulfur cluster biosynthesis family protein [Thermoanaerobaculia bacterium]|nr:iron-sulfur cluster biosynthesis family protein [Thermoanaerobaculia bacterium]